MSLGLGTRYMTFSNLKTRLIYNHPIGSVLTTTYTEMVGRLALVSDAVYEALGTQMADECSRSLPRQIPDLWCPLGG